MRPPREPGRRPAIDKALGREILLGFWKCHILHHASEDAVHGQWIIEELREHGHDISPGTLYPLLRRLEALGWLSGRKDGRGPKAPKRYHLTPLGAEVLDRLRGYVRELEEELLPRPGRRTH